MCNRSKGGGWGWLRPLPPHTHTSGFLRSEKKILYKAKERGLVAEGAHGLVGAPGTLERAAGLHGLLVLLGLARMGMETAPRTPASCPVLIRAPLLTQEGPWTSAWPWG